MDPVPLNGNEEVFWRGSHRLAVVCRLDGCVDGDVLARATRRVEQRHPKLRAVAVPGTDGRRRYDLSRLAPALTVDVADFEGADLPWREQTRRLLQVGPPPEVPLAAMAVLRDRTRNRSDLILAVHHGVADGRSAIALLDELLAEYAAIEAGIEPPPVVPMPVISAVRAVPSGGWRGRLRLIRRFTRLQLAERRVVATPLPLADDVPPLSQWAHWVLTGAETVRLIRRCRKERASLGAAMIGAVCCGLMDALDVRDGLFKWHSAFDVRGSLTGPGTPLTARDLGCFMAMMRGFCRVGREPALWPLARAVDAEIQEFVRNGGPAVGYNLSAAGLRPVVTRVEPTLFRTNARRPTLFVTNYGVLDLPERYGSLQPRACTLVFIGDDLTKPWLTVEALVLGQSLNVGFVADGLAAGFWERLEAAVHARVAAAAADETAPSRAGATSSPPQAPLHRISVAPQE